MLTDMPALPVVPNVVKADLQWSVSSDITVATGLFFEYSGTAPNNAAALSLAATIYAAWAANNSLWDEDTSAIGCKVTDLSSSSGGVGEHAGSTAGGLTEPIAGSSCLLVNYAISRRYRGGRPRSYLPWGDATKLGNRQTWEASFITAANAAITDTFAAIIGSSSGGTTITNHVNVSYYEGFTLVTSPTTGRGRNVPTLRTAPLVDTISGFAASTRVASQRRRG
jgi:hypothetical protein